MLAALPKAAVTRKRGDGVLAESSTGRSQEKSTCEMQVHFSWALSTKMQLLNLVKYSALPNVK
jgi:hypothetical protein